MDTYKNMIKPINGIVYICSYCGEGLSSNAKFCKNCKTQSGRKEIFEANIEIAKENLKKGYKIPESFKSWKQC